MTNRRIPKQSKFRAEKIAGYDSHREYRRACLLKAMQRSGIISNLREQVKFTLVPCQRGPDGKLLEREVAYIADFVYTDSDGNTVVEDTKGFRTPEYIIKRKLMLSVHGISINEI